MRRGYFFFASIAFFTNTRGEIRERKTMRSLPVEQKVGERLGGRYIEASPKEIREIQKYQSQLCLPAHD